MPKPKKPEKDPNAVALGRKGGTAKMALMSPEQRHDMAMKGVVVRQRNILRRTLTAVAQAKVKITTTSR